MLIACAFNYEAHASEFSKLGRIPVLKARMNADLHMGGDLKATAIMKLKEVIDELEAAADAFEKVAHTVEGIAVKES